MGQLENSTKKYMLEVYNHKISQPNPHYKMHRSSCTALPHKPGAEIVGYFDTYDEMQREVNRRSPMVFGPCEVCRPNIPNWVLQEENSGIKLYETEP